MREETGFADLCDDTRNGLRNAVDLVLIHNEKDVRGKQPRAVLNDLTVVLAVAAWERFVVDVQALGTRKWTGPGHHRKTDGIAYLGHPGDPAKPGPARIILDHASNSRDADTPAGSPSRAQALWPDRLAQAGDVGDASILVAEAMRPGRSSTVPLRRTDSSGGGKHEQR
jgi:hypothetical protein